MSTSQLDVTEWQAAGLPLSSDVAMLFWSLAVRVYALGWQAVVIGVAPATEIMSDALFEAGLLDPTMTTTRPVGSEYLDW